MFRTRFRLFSFAAGAALLVSASAPAQETWTWLAGSTADVADASNWSLSSPGNLAGPPGVTVAPQFGRIGSFGAVGSTTLTQSNANYLLEQFIFQPGAQAYTYTATDAAAYLSFAPELTTVDINAVDNQSTSLQIFNLPSTGTGLGIDGYFKTTAGGGDIVVNGPLRVSDGSTSGARYSGATGTGNIYFNVDTTVHPNGNVSGGAWTSVSINTNAYANTRGRFFTDGLSGRVYLGDIGTDYRGSIHLNSNQGGAVRLTHNNSLGNQGAFGGTGTGVPSVFIQGGNFEVDPVTAYSTTLELVNNISVRRAAMFLQQRAGATIGNVPHISNVSGNNTLTVGADWNTYGTNSRTSGFIDGNWNIESQAGKLTIVGGDAGGLIYNTAPVNLNLQLMGAGDGEITTQITTYQTNPSLSLVKVGDGTWTLSHAMNDYAGTTTINDGTLSVTGGYVGTGAWTVNSGGALGGTGNISAPVTLNGTLSPGTSPGTLTVNNAFTVGSGAVFNMDLSTPGDTLDDQLTVLGDLAFQGGTNTLNVMKIGGGTLTTGDYLLADATSLSGALPTTTINAPLAIGDTASIFVDFPQSDIYLRVVPEPSLLALAALALSSLIAARGRRRSY
jgi:autotransporter-associated beta strand protein